MSRPDRTLIIKLGSLGDVVRTTPLLRRLDGHITWVCSDASEPLLSGLPGLAEVVPLSRAELLSKHTFDTVINLDEADAACRISSSVRTARRIGPRYELGRKVYDKASAPMFDRGLISRLGRRRADALKFKGRSTYQQLAFRVCGLRFRGEEMILPRGLTTHSDRMIGLETRVGPTWPAKAWGGWTDIESRLSHAGWKTLRLKPRRHLNDYIRDISSCRVIVTGDTLAMHLALALHKPTVALFLCTSPAEIYSYGRLTKLVHPKLKSHWYDTRPAPNFWNGIPAEDVFVATLKAAAQSSAGS